LPLDEAVALVKEAEQERRQCEEKVKEVFGENGN